MQNTGYMIHSTDNQYYLYIYTYVDGSIIKMTPLIPEYIVWAQCFTPAGSQRLIIAEDVFLYDALLAMLHYIPPTEMWIDFTFADNTVPFLSPVMWVDFIIVEDHWGIQAQHSVSHHSAPLYFDHVMLGFALVSLSLSLSIYIYIYIYV